ncbi:hypothetical protein [Hungatella hathewayi]|uniref:hypothetical protein n=1 Tax=Hungatella hathewayi TaxID=154046 RepID=UPI003565F244
MPRKNSGNPDDWDFRFFVFSEWYDSHTAGVEAGSDLEMPSPGLDSRENSRRQRVRSC